MAFSIYPMDGTDEERLGTYPTQGAAVTAACQVIEQSSMLAEMKGIAGIDRLTFRIQQYGLTVLKDDEAGHMVLVRRRGCPPWCRTYHNHERD